MPTITSRQNPIVARYRAVVRGDQPDRILIDGAHLVGEALAAGIAFAETAVTAAAADSPALMNLLSALARAGVEVVTVSPAVMDALSPVRTSTGIVALASRPRPGEETIYSSPSPLVVVAVDIQDTGKCRRDRSSGRSGGRDGPRCGRRVRRPIRMESAARIDGERVSSADCRRCERRRRRGNRARARMPDRGNRAAPGTFALRRNARRRAGDPRRQRGGRCFAGAHRQRRRPDHDSNASARRIPEHRSRRCARPLRSAQRGEGG